MDYRTRVKTLPDTAGLYPQHGDQWGDWQFNAQSLTLEYRPDGVWRYEVDLERIRSSASMLDCIFQINGHQFHKQWPSNLMQDLVDALDDIFYPQANLCSFGQDSRIKPTEFLLSRIKLGAHPPTRRIEFRVLSQGR